MTDESGQTKLELELPYAETFERYLQASGKTPSDFIESFILSAMENDSDDEDGDENTGTVVAYVDTDKWEKFKERTNDGVDLADASPREKLESVMGQAVKRVVLRQRQMRQSHPEDE